MEFENKIKNMLPVLIVMNVELFLYSAWCTNVEHFFCSTWADSTKCKVTIVNLRLLTFRKDANMLKAFHTVSGRRQMEFSNKHPIYPFPGDIMLPH